MSVHAMFETEHIVIKKFDRDVFFVHILIDSFAERQRNTSKLTVCSPLLRSS